LKPVRFSSIHELEAARAKPDRGIHPARARFARNADIADQSN
jgi:hypothetical protein